MQRPWIQFKDRVLMPLLPRQVHRRESRRFEATVDRILDALGVANVRLSLFAIAVDGSRTVDVVRTLATRLAPSHIVGRLTSGLVGILYLGPRPAGVEADLDVERAVANRVAEALRRPAVAGGFPPFRIRSVHRCTDEIGAARDLIDALGDLSWLRPSPIGGDLDRIFDGLDGANSVAGPGAPARPWRIGFMALALAATMATFMDPAAWAGPFPSKSGAGATVVGMQWPRGMDESDQARVAEAVGRPASNVYVEWLNPRTDIRYTLFVSRVATRSEGGICREIVLTQNDGGGPRQTLDTLCKDMADAAHGGAGGGSAR